MAKTYSPAPDDVRTVVNEMLAKHYPELIKAGVTIDLISVAHDNEDKPALTLHGYPCAAVIRVVGIKERTKGAGDVEIVIDEERWMDLGIAQQRALIDHELRHIALKMTKDDNDKEVVAIDCRGRPRVGMHKHDVQVGWFKDIADRHGEASFEVVQAQAIFLSHRQTFFPFVPDAKALNA